MVISDQYKFVFMHIPKCGGSTIRLALKDINDTPWKEPEFDHDELGHLHSTHLPLWMLSEYFPDVYEKVREYDSFAVSRDPMDRFFSALTQKCRSILGVPSGDITPKVLADAADDVISHLEKSPRKIDFEHMHFIPQHEFIFLEGEQVVQQIDVLGRFEKLDAFLRQSGLPLIQESERENESVEPAGKFMSALVHMARPLVLPLLPGGVRALIWRRLIRMGLYRPVQNHLYEQLLTNHRVVDFVHQFYAKDFEIYNDALHSQGERLV